MAFVNRHPGQVITTPIELVEITAGIPEQRPERGYESTVGCDGDQPRIV